MAAPASEHKPEVKGLTLTLHAPSVPPPLPPPFPPPPPSIFFILPSVFSVGPSAGLGS